MPRFQPTIRRAMILVAIAAIAATALALQARGGRLREAARRHASAVLFYHILRDPIDGSPMMGIDHKGRPIDERGMRLSDHHLRMAKKYAHAADASLGRVSSDSYDRGPGDRRSVEY